MEDPADNRKLVEEFGASLISGLKILPDFYTFNNGLVYSHREFDAFMAKLLKGEKSAIVSGVNPSATLHMGHLPLFDTNLFFQKKFGSEVFIPLSDDESYVSLKSKSQEEAFKTAVKLARSLLAFGFDPKKTHFIIDQVYTDIYNLAIKLSRGITMSEIRAVYGYTPDQNTGLHFYPSIQAAHITFPQTIGIPNVLVPIGPDEDPHLRVARDVAAKFGYNKAGALHMRFLPGLDGDPKMSKSKGNGIFLLDKEAEIKKKVMSAFSGGQTSVEEHRKKGGDPDVDIPFTYLKYMFFTPDEARDVAGKYRRGEILSGEMKQMLLERVMVRVKDFQTTYSHIREEDVVKAIMHNGKADVARMVSESGAFE